MLAGACFPKGKRYTSHVPGRIQGVKLLKRLTPCTLSKITEREPAPGACFSNGKTKDGPEHRVELYPGFRKSHNTDNVAPRGALKSYVRESTSLAELCLPQGKRYTQHVPSRIRRLKLLEPAPGACFPKGKRQSLHKILSDCFWYKEEQ